MWLLVDPLKKISSYIPKEDRLKLFNYMYEECNHNSRILSEVSGIQLRRIYFYLPSKKNIIRNYPNDLTAYLLLKAYFHKNPRKALQFLMNICQDINRLKTTLYLKEMHIALYRFYDILM